jgi:hypothetical protein
MSDNKEALKTLTEKFINEFIELSGETPTFAINAILPEIIYPLLPQYKESSYSLYLPMSHFETNLAKEGVNFRLKGWTGKLLEIVEALEAGKDTDFDRYRFEGLVETTIEKEGIKITDYTTLKCKKVVFTCKVKSFNIVSTTNDFKGTVSLTFSKREGLYPVSDVVLTCGHTKVFDWSLYEENGERTLSTVDADNIKDLNSFYYYTAQ